MRRPVRSRRRLHQAPSDRRTERLTGSRLKISSAIIRGLEAYRKRRSRRRMTVSRTRSFTVIRCCLSTGSPRPPRLIVADCPICYDELSATDSQLTYCLGAGGCGRRELFLAQSSRSLGTDQLSLLSTLPAIHNECLGQWVRTQQSLGKEVTCCWCRTKLMTGSTGSSGKASQDGI
jgi:hypothetical protein